eukprot:6062707-Prymnesium_polylepis.1
MGTCARCGQGSWRHASSPIILRRFPKKANAKQTPPNKPRRVVSIHQIPKLRREGEDPRGTSETAQYG